LKSLKISNVSLRSEISNIGDFVVNLKKLIYLDLSFNNISTMRNIDKIENLIYLNLKFNMIDDISVSLYTNFNFDLLHNLEYVNLNKSITKKLSSFELKFDNKLEHAILSCNDLRIFPNFCQQNITIHQDISEFSCNLRILYFDNNKLDKIDLKNLISLENLEYFNLDSNNIRLIDDDSFSNLKSLRTGI
jgi:Leucine-rich repeat (LRR) protein